MDRKPDRTAQDIFLDMHRELRKWNADVPESPERMDPILRIMLQLFSKELSKIDGKITATWTLASNALIKSLYPECLHWPVPAYTIMQAEPTDPVIHIDPQTHFFYKEDREDGQTFYFSAVRKEKLLKARLKNIFFRVGDNLHDISSQQTESTVVTSRPQTSAFVGREAFIYLAIEHDGQVDDFDDCLVFLQGNEEAIRQLRWARWLPCIDGDFDERSHFCPGTIGRLDDIFSAGGESIDWGGLRKSSDLFAPLENRFIVIPKSFVTPWRSGNPDRAFLESLTRAGLAAPENSEKLYWIKASLPRGRDSSVFQSSFRMRFDSFVAVNKYERTVFKHTGGNRLIEIEIPDNSRNILEIISVADSNGVVYVPRHEALSSRDAKFYNLLDRENRLRLWFDFSAGVELPPDSITVNYSITAGTAANGISAGRITELYENHPGIASIRNILPVTGAIPAKTEEQVVAEISARLRGRDRALSFEQIESWVKTFDSRIVKSECEKGVTRTPNGVRKCVVVKVGVREKDFYSDDEIALLKRRLESFLKARSSINSQFRLEIVKT